MTAKFFRLNFIVLLLCFFSVEIVGGFDPQDGLSQPDTDIEADLELVRPISYKLVKIPVPEKESLKEIPEFREEKQNDESAPFYGLISHATHNFFVSGAKRARELSTIS